MDDDRAQKTAATRENARAVVRRLRQAGFESYFAGGCVRDHLRGREPADFDIATAARPDQVEALFRRTLAVGKAFGVIRVACHGEWFEVATFRRDGNYADGRRPEGVEFCGAAEDAARRDFTINGMFWDPENGQIIDHVGGLPDLSAGVIRAIGDAAARISEDALRLLRAVRFAAKEGFAIEPGTAEAIHQNRERLAAVSPERIREELQKMAKVGAAGRARAVSLLSSTGLLFVIFPECQAGGAAESERIVARCVTPGVELFLAGLLGGVLDPGTPVARWRAFAERISDRLRLSNDECTLLTVLLGDRVRARQARVMTLARRRLCAARASSDVLGELLRAEGGADDAVDLLAETRRTDGGGLPPPLLDGNAVMALGAPRGRALGVLLRRLRILQLGGRLLDPAAAEAWVRARVSSGPGLGQAGPKPRG